MAVSSNILARAVKVQALTASDNPNEAESAARQLLALMRAHAITEADLEAAKTRVEDPLVKVTCYLDGLRCLRFENRERKVYALAKWKRALFMEVARYCGLRTSYRSGTAIASLYGHASDCAAAMGLYEVCARQIDRECRAWLKLRKEEEEEAGWAWESGTARTEGFSFKESAVRGLEAKFAELMRESRVEDATGTGLVLQRAKKVSSWVDATYTFKTGSSADYTGTSGYCADGYAAGHNLSLTEDKAIESEDEPKQLEGE